MKALIVASTRAVRSLLAPGMPQLFVMTVLLTVVTLALFVAIASSFFIWLGGHLHGDMASLVPWLGSGMAAVAAWLLFPGIMPVIASFFDERITRVIERQDYAAASFAPATSPWQDLFHDMRFAATVILLNIVVLPLYLLPVINLFLFYLLNGYLLGREFFVMAARRHMPVQEAERLRKQHARTVTVAGVALTLLATVPVLNLLAPFWGIAVMVHLYHRFAGTPEARLLPPQ